MVFWRRFLGVGLSLLQVFLGVTAQAQTRVSDIRFLPSAGLRYTNRSGGTVGFTSIESFLPLGQRPGNITYIAPIFNVFDTGELGGNFILGQRVYDLENRRLFGGYISWDGREYNGYFYHQIGLGFETAFDLWNVNLNGYIPVGRSRRQTGEQILGLARVPFRGNRLFLEGINFFDAAMYGFDIEVGRIIPLHEKGYLRPFMGGYFLTAERSDNALGIRGGLQAIREGISGSLALQHDGLFGTQVLFSIGIHLTEWAGIRRTAPATTATIQTLLAQAGHQPLELPEGTLSLATASFVQQLGALPTRRNAITIEQQRIRDDIIARGPDGQPYEVFHVVVGAAGGNGTAENPFGTIQPALNAAANGNNSLVYVRSGNNTGLAPFTVPSGTQVFSSAVNYPLPVRTRFNPIRTITIPAIAGDVRPVVQGTFGPGNLASGQAVITLGSNTTLAGFEVQITDTLPVGGTPGRRGIAAVGSENIRILHNVVNNALGEGIYLENVQGRAEIINNTVMGTRSNIGAFADFNGAIFLTNSQGNINAVMQGNTVTVPAGATEVDGIEINLCRSGAPFIACSGPVFGRYLVTGNTVTAPGATGGADGIDFNFGTGAHAIVQILNNTINQFPDKAISFGGIGSNNVAALIGNNAISNVGDNGIHIRPRENSNFRSSVTIDGVTVSGITITNNSISNVRGRGIDVRLDDDGGLLAANTAQADVELRNNTITNAGQDGIRLRTEQGGQLNAVVQGNTVNASGGSGGDAGIFLRSEGTSRLNATLVNNVVTNTATGRDAGVLGRADNNSTMCLQIQFNRSQNPAIAKDFRLRRNAATANLQLFGITSSLPVAANSSDLRSALEAQGNIANVSADSRFQVQSNPVQVPTAICTFP